MTPSRIERVTFRLLAQCLNQLRHQQRAPQCVAPYLKFRRKNCTKIKKLEKVSVNEKMGTEDSNHTLRMPQNYHMINTASVVLVRMDKNVKLLQAANLVYF